MKYRIVTNGEWYEIEYRPWWWPFWFRYEPHFRRLEPPNWSLYRFKTITAALERIDEIKEEDDKSNFHPVELDNIG